MLFHEGIGVFLHIRVEAVGRVIEIASVFLRAARFLIDLAHPVVGVVNAHKLFVVDAVQHEKGVRGIEGRQIREVDSGNAL